MLRHVYESRVDLFDGSVAPDFKLKSLDGKNVSLSDFKGKWVMLSFPNINRCGHQRNVLAFQEMKKALPSENFELLIAFSQSDREETEKFLKEHNIKAIRKSAIDYLLKPVNILDLKEAVNRAIEKKELKGNQNSQLTNYLKNRESAESLHKIALPTSERLLFVTIEDIIRCQGENNYTKFFLIGSQDNKRIRRIA